MLFPFLIEPKHLLVENLNLHQCVTLQMGLVRSSEVEGRGCGWRGCISGVGLGTVDKSPHIDQIQRHLDTYIPTDPHKATNEAVGREWRRKLGGVKCVTKTYVVQEGACVSLTA